MTKKTRCGSFMRWLGGATCAVCADYFLALWYLVPGFLQFLLPGSGFLAGLINILHWIRRCLQCLPLDSSFSPTESALCLCTVLSHNSCIASWGFTWPWPWQKQCRLWELLNLAKSLLKLGEHMWQFALGLFLVYLDGKVLRMAAIYGFVGGGVILLFGGMIGNWVDRNKRLKVIRTVLIVRNASVVLCATTVCLVLVFETEVNSGLGGGLWYICGAIILSLGVLAQIGQLAYTIAIEKDWIVVVAKKDKSKLANLNAVIRVIYLSCKVLTPVVAGQIMTFGSLFIAAIVIGVWSLISVFVEYALLNRVYNLVPRLATKHDQSAWEKDSIELKDSDVAVTSDVKPSTDEDGDKNVYLQVPSDESSPTVNQDRSEMENLAEEERSLKKQKSYLQRLFESLSILVNGWRVYARQRILLAGVSLALLYMTVLGFGSITTGYMYASGINEAALGGLKGLAALNGIIGTICFTQLRKRFGLKYSGIAGFWSEITCLSLSVISIWLPGSPFEPHYRPGSTQGPEAALLSSNSSLMLSNQVGPTYDVISGNTSLSSYNSSLCSDGNCHVITHSSITVSIVVFLVGVMTSRIGLWIADLVVTQLIQENVMEKERGVVNGVQNSLNMFLDMLKYIMVIFIPHIQHFGYLIIVSFCFVCSGGLCFTLYTVRSKTKRSQSPDGAAQKQYVEVEQIS